MLGPIRPENPSQQAEQAQALQCTAALRRSISVHKTAVHT